MTLTFGNKVVLDCIVFYNCGVNFAHPVAKLLKADAGVVIKVVNDALVHPAALVLQGLRQVPVVQRDHGLDVVGQQRVDEVVVVLHTQQVQRAWGAVRQHPTPGDGETVVLYLTDTG